MNDIGDRMKKNYEDRSRFYLTRRTPVIIRIDGRAFHTLTRGCKKPFDNRVITGVCEVMHAMMQGAQGAKVGYCQSDEISILLTDWDNWQTEAWFDYNLAKIVSISASIATRAFNSKPSATSLPDAEFDARAFNIPREEVANYFLWRAKDWYRNSVTMYAQSMFSHSALQGKSCADMHEMLYTKGRNWATDLTAQQKNGTFAFRDDVIKYAHPQCNYTDIAQLIEKVMP